MFLHVIFNNRKLNDQSKEDLQKTLTPETDF
ncbi:hypothetical protein T11_18464 [Trichinella zimbabwensis]|uniref:Uncharacterized protein n=1 Tax=Trichinella zimbabwensis TaxID=268475 RepID=A0A0V1GCW4_9BILA|nr:hypothetical protein T11_18464 [Trichinella zimbabwensis]